MSNAGCICITSTDAGCPVHGLYDPSSEAEIMSNLPPTLPWRCDVTNNPVGTDTVKIGYRCQCQGHRAAAEIETLKHDLSKSLADKAALLGALGMLLEAVNPSDRNAISMHEWNTRLKAASAVASEAITSAEAAS